MEYSSLDETKDTPLVGVTYSRDAKSVAAIYSGGRPWRPETKITETVTFDVPANASVEIRVSTDARGTLRRIVSHAAPTAETAPAWTRTGHHDRLMPGVFDVYSTVPWASVSPPALTFSVVIDPKDTLLHVSVTDLKDARATITDRFMKLSDFRSPHEAPQSGRRLYVEPAIGATA